MFSKVNLRHYLLLAFSLAAWPAVGIYGLGLTSIIDLIHFTSIPLVASYFLIFRPEIIRQRIPFYCVFLTVVTLLVGGYLIVFSYSLSYMRANWVQLPVAIYFLASVYLILWLLDGFIVLFSSLPAAITRKKTNAAAATIKTTLRLALLVFVAIPYLVAIFTTHWIKFSSKGTPADLFAMEYRHISFNAADGTNLDSWFIPSTTNLSDSTVIIAPGRNATKNLFLPYAKILSDNGFNILLLDLRGNGDSGGYKYSFTVSEVNDLLMTVDYLENKFAESSEYIFGLGFNEGASALVAAAAADDRFTAVVIDSASGYDIILPGSLSDYLPAWMKNTLLKITRSFIAFDIGRTGWGTEKLHKDIAAISPCPVLVANSIKSDKSNRLRAIELYALAKDPKMLWLTPPLMDEDNTLRLDIEYFQSILSLFNFGKTKQQPGYLRTTRRF